jgi:hypothetical protein
VQSLDLRSTVACQRKGRGGPKLRLAWTPPLGTFRPTGLGLVPLECASLLPLWIGEACCIGEMRARLSGSLKMARRGGPHSKWAPNSMFWGIV